MKYYFLGFFLVFLLQCKQKKVINPEKVYPAGIQLNGISGKPINLLWRAYGGYYCGFECIPDEDDYEHITPDYFEIYTGTSKNNLTKFKTISGKIETIDEIFSDNQTVYVQIQAVYAAGTKKIASNVIMISSDKAPQAQKLDVENTKYTFTYQAETYSSTWMQRTTLLGTEKAILMGTNSKNEYGTWYRDFLNNKQQWLWNNITLSSWSPDNKKALLNKILDKKTESVSELYLFDSATLQLTPINFLGKSVISFTWAPDANSIAFSVIDDNGNYILYTTSVTNIRLVKVFETNNNTAAFTAGTQGLEVISKLKWVQNDILFQKTNNYIKGNQTLGETHVYRLNIDSKIMTIVPDFEESDWGEVSLDTNPSGTKIAFVSRRSGYVSIWVKDLEKKRSYQVSNQLCLPCNLSVEQWTSNNELTYSASNSNTGELSFYKIKVD